MSAMPASNENTCPFSNLKIGVLAVQGAVSEHIEAVKRCGAEAIPVRDSGLIPGLDGLIIPGGESTTIGRLSGIYGYREKINSLAAAGKPLFGTCAGLIFLAAEIENQEPILPLMSIKTRRNAFGRQRESFEADLAIPVLGEKPFCGVFIRAPQITSVGKEVKILSSYRDGVVAAQQENLLVTAFHPELTDDLRLHYYFLNLAREVRDKTGFPQKMENPE